MCLPDRTGGVVATIEPGSRYRRVRWRKPADVKRRPPVLDATRSELVRGLEQKHGSLWGRIAGNVIVAGYARDRALNRVRRLRNQGAESLLAMAVALLYLADVRTGFIGRPQKGAQGAWDRYTLRDLAQMAFGAQTEADIRRARRAIDMMISLGWAFPTRQVRRFNEADQSFISLAGVRRLNLDRLCSMAGTSWLLKRDRMHARDTKPNPVVDIRERRNAERMERRGKAEESLNKRPLSYTERKARAAATGDPPGAGGLRNVVDILSKG